MTQRSVLAAAMALQLFLSGQARADVDGDFSQFHMRRLAFCQYFPQDEFCGGDDRNAVSSQQSQARAALERAAAQFADSVLTSSAYEAQLQAIDLAYRQADEAARLSYRLVGGFLNRAWLNRYQSEIDLWLTTSQDTANERLVYGWLVYSAAFAVTPEFRNIGFLHNFLRSRLPWSVLGAGIAGLAALNSQSAAASTRPQVPPPPYSRLTFGDLDQPGSDLQAQRDHREFATFQEIFASNAGLVALMAAGPNFTLSATAGLGRLTALLGRMVSSVRITPYSAIVAWLATELAGWTYAKAHADALKFRILNASDDRPYAAQTLSLSINGLHILYLGDLDAAIRRFEKALTLLNDEELQLKDVAAGIRGQSEAEPYFMTFALQPTPPNARMYLVNQLWNYRRLAGQARKLAGELSNLAPESPLKKEVLARRIELLNRQADGLEQRFRDFPAAEVQSKLLAAFKRPPEGTRHEF